MSVSEKEIVEALEDPAFYSGQSMRVTHLETHISHVFLTGGLVYKVKRRLDLGFLDFTTLERRIHFCREELRLNRRLAPDIYLKVVAVLQEPGGRLFLGDLEEGPGEVVEAAVCMREMEQDRMMDQLLAAGRVAADQVERIGLILARFYGEAQTGGEIELFGRPDKITFNVSENFEQTRDQVGACLGLARWQGLKDYGEGFLPANWWLFLNRISSGRIRDCHGDLHSANINLARDGEAHIFDCIEFTPRFRYQDVACDLAFLAMDLDFNGRPDLSAALLDSYAKASGDLIPSGLWDFYKCYRAVVRAKIYGFMQADETLPAVERFRDQKKAAAYWRLAAGYAGLPRPVAVAFMGLMGTGKSYLARALSGRTGWQRISSDATRKELAGLEAGQKQYDGFGRGLYGSAMTQRVYQTALKRAAAALEMGEGVIVDASFKEERWRREFLDTARAAGARPLLVEVTASREVVLKRLQERETRGNSESDGRSELVDAQAKSWEPVVVQAAGEYIRMDGGLPLAEKLALLAGALEETGQ